MTPTANYMGNRIVQFLGTMGIAATSELHAVGPCKGSLLCALIRW